jgi:hypothetical protein
MGDTLLDHCLCLDDGPADLCAFSFFSGDHSQLGLVNGQGICVDGGLRVRLRVSTAAPYYLLFGMNSQAYLRNEPIRHGNPDDTRDKRCTSEKKKVPVETRRLFQRKLPRLCGQTANVLERVVGISIQS